MTTTRRTTKPRAAATAARVVRAGERVAAGDKHEVILDAALDLFVERGFYGTAVPEIAARAGVGAGTIYRYFESKEALVNALFRQTKTAFARVALDELPPDVPTRELFRTLWMRMAAYATAHTRAFVFMELHHHARYLDAESRALEQRLTTLFSNIVVSAQARGDLKKGPAALIMGVVMGAFVGVIRSCVASDQPVDQADWSFAEQMTWEAIRS